MFNKFVCTGRLTKDPELRYTTSGQAVCNFTVAINHKYKDQDETLFLSNVVFGKQAENICNYTRKGSFLLIEGRLTEREWEYNGEKHKKMEIMVQRIEYLSTKSLESLDDKISSASESESEEAEPF